jgi:hypothetical protein
MLVTLLVLWFVVVPVLTLAGSYVLSGVLGRRPPAGSERSPDLIVEPVRIAARQRHRAPVRLRSHASRPRDHALSGR